MKIKGFNSWLILIVAILIILLVAGFKFYSISHKFDYTIKISPADEKSILLEDVSIILERIDLHGYNAKENITLIDGKETLILRTDKRLYNDTNFLLGLGIRGKFEGKIGSQTIFEGGKDISHVERSERYAKIKGCAEYENGFFCQFIFPISLTEEAAKRHAEITSKLGVNPEAPEYLSEKLDFYIDGSLVDSLFISKDLKGQAITQILIQGSGVGITTQDALKNAEDNMQKLQDILDTGGLNKEYIFSRV